LTPLSILGYCVWFYVILDLVLVIFRCNSHSLLILSDVRLSCHLIIFLVLNKHWVGFFYLLTDSWCLIYVSIWLWYQLSCILSWTRECLFICIRHKSCLARAKYSLFRTNLLLHLVSYGSSLILARSWSQINWCSSLKSLFIWGKCWLNCLNTAFALTIHLVRSRAYVVHWVLRCVFGWIKSFNSWSKELEALWFLAGLKRCHGIWIIVCSRSWCFHLFIIINDINLVLGHFTHDSWWSINLLLALRSPCSTKYSTITCCRSGHLWSKNTWWVLFRYPILTA